MGATLGAAGITAGAQLAGGALDQGVMQPKQRRQAKQDTAWERGVSGQAQAAKINDALGMLLGERSGGRGGGMLDEANERLLDFDHSGLKATASRNFTQNSNAARAALGSAGLGSSGAGSLALGRAYSDTMSNLSQAIADDTFRRQQAAGANTMSAGLAGLAASQNTAFGDAGFADTKEFEKAMKGGK